MTRCNAEGPAGVGLPGASGVRTGQAVCPVRTGNPPVWTETFDLLGEMRLLCNFRPGEVVCDELFGTTTISKMERCKEELNRFKFQQEKPPISPMRGTAPEFAIEDQKKYLSIKAAEISSPLRIPRLAATPIFCTNCPSCVKTAPSRPLLLSRASAALP